MAIDHDAWLTTPPNDAPWDLEAVRSALTKLRNARGKLRRAGLLSDAADGHFEALETELETTIEDLQ
jgi:hypothetical protein